MAMAAGGLVLTLCAAPSACVAQIQVVSAGGEYESFHPRPHPHVAAAGGKVVSTDLPAGELGRFVGLAAGARSRPLTSVQFVPPLVDPAHPDPAVIRAEVQRALHPSSTPSPAVSTPTPTPSAPVSTPAPSGLAEGITPKSSNVQSVCSAG